MPHLFAFTIDTTINVQSIMMAVVGVILSYLCRLIAIGINKATHFVNTVQGLDGRVESTAEVVDLHSDVLIKGGLVQGVILHPVSRRRRKTDGAIDTV